MTYRFEVWQDGIVVAAVEGPIRHRVLQEIARYATLYETEGPVEIKEKRLRRS